MVEFVRIIGALLHAERRQNNRRRTSLPDFSFSFSYSHLGRHASRSLLMVMVVMMLLASRKEVMGRYAISTRLKFFGWLATAVMAAAVIAMFATT